MNEREKNTDLCDNQTSKMEEEIIYDLDDAFTAPYYLLFEVEKNFTQ